MNVVALLDQIGNHSNESVLAFVALARIHPTYREKNVPTFHSQAGALCRAISGRECLPHSVRQYEHSFRFDRCPREHGCTGVTRDTQHKVSRFHSGTLRFGWPRPGLNPMSLHDELRSLEALDQCG